MSELSEYEEDAARAVLALRAAAAYLAVDDRRRGGPCSQQSLLVGEGLAAAERVLMALGTLRRPGDGASAAYPGWSDPDDGCPRRWPGAAGGARLRRPSHGDPGE